ncbi:MAG TPA: hypothetical protein VF855_12750 [Acidimicrobiales bacterium]
MAEISSAIVCDFAQVREGLLFISSGGITRLRRQSLPAPLGIAVAIVVELPFDEVKDNHTVTARITHVASATDVLRTEVGVQANDPAVEPGESLYVPLVVSLHQVTVSAYGAYDIVVSVDHGVGRTLTVYAVA